jgi:hypothetical protein
MVETPKSPYGLPLPKHYTSSATATAKRSASLLRVRTHRREFRSEVEQFVSGPKIGYDMSPLSQSERSSLDPSWQAIRPEQGKTAFPREELPNENKRSPPTS